ncbi:DNA-binding SAP [Penicillium angulare]|uniref:DNA-binding SAP n=1 Tax=Penicillium angulare TaxID=116970 RepID=UPI0025420DEF|nr:DNA-binding SAP [Penicillium angulare]KAJ5287236.1 DNA-binding SAP [Penicillium angulare]
MSDYPSWKVADLKAELKNRGIPQTGLRLKQQIIDKLVEEDAKAQPEEAAAAPSEPQPETLPEPEPQPEAQQPPVEKPVASPQEGSTETAPEEPQQDTPVTQEEPLQPSPAREDETPRKDEEPLQPEVAKEVPVEEGTETENEDMDMTRVDSVAGEEDKTEEKSETQLVKQAPGDVDEPMKESSVLSAIPTSETNTEFSTPLPIEEALEDKRKRKRRSQSPVPTPEAIANKKARAKEESPRVQLKDDNEFASQEIEAKDTAVEHQSAPTEQKEASSAPPKQDARFRGLFTPSGPALARKSSPTRDDVPMEDAEVEPALHPATAALYIDGLMRPLQPNALRNHLISLAAAPGSDPNPEIIQDFFLDAIKTHCFAGFTGVAAASRVRAGLHGTTWPNERNRKTLRADFIPEDQVKQFIQTEEESRDRSGPPVRWEVQYEPSSEGQGIRAVLTESGPTQAAASSRPREAGFNRTPPLGPRGSVSAQVDHRPSNAPPAPPSRPGQGFKPLDDLFESTTTKPKLYYLRVPRKIADQRLDQFDEILKKGTFPRRGGDDMRRITFEDEDYFVDGGSEYGPKGMPSRGGRGGGRNRGGRRGRDF